MIQAAEKKQSKTLRVAIYARQSVSEENEAFGSIEAQRASVEHYIQSQPGWRALPCRYDDAGFTGANCDRPAFQRLLADVDAGKIDVVACYKLDRLSRSLHDFTALMARFEARGVAFVSTTQQFNTATSVGRLTLNLLATFAQFERETICERTRDKMQAARRRGHWTGGHVPMGYDLVGGALVVNPEEAVRVRAIFELYQTLGTLTATCAELDRRGWRSKSWINAAGKRVEGKPFDAMRLRMFLLNPVLRGKIRSGDTLFPALHPAIVGDELAAAVDAALAKGAGEKNHRRGSARDPVAWHALLSGLLRCGRCGAAMVHGAVRKDGKSHRYYVCRTLARRGAQACPGSRVAAGEIEAFVVEKLRASRAPDIGNEDAWAELFPAARAQAVAAVLESVVYDASAGTIELVERKAAGGAPA